MKPESMSYHYNGRSANPRVATFVYKPKPQTTSNSLTYFLLGAVSVIIIGGVIVLTITLLV